MKQEEERKDFLDKFSKMTFIEKKNECLTILKKLYWISEDINTLWNIVYNSNDENNQEILIKVYNLLLDALYYAEDKQSERVIEKLEEIRNNLSLYKKEEEEEKKLENQNLDELFQKLD